MARTRLSLLAVATLPLLAGLEGEAGNKTRCTATGPDGTLGITVTVRSADGDNAQLNFKGDDKVTK